MALCGTAVRQRAAAYARLWAKVWRCNSMIRAADMHAELTWAAAGALRRLLMYSGASQRQR